MKAIKQYLPVVLFIMLFKVVLTFEFVDEILQCDRSNESYRAVLSCATFFFVAQGRSCEILRCESVDEILKCDYSNKSYWTILFCGTVCYAVHGGSFF